MKDHVSYKAVRNNAVNQNDNRSTVHDETYSMAIVTGHHTIGFDSVFKAIKLPAGVTD